MTTKGRPHRSGDRGTDPRLIDCPACSALPPPYGKGVMAVTEADGWRHAEMCTTCRGWGRVLRAQDGPAGREGREGAGDSGSGPSGVSYVPVPSWACVRRRGGGRERS